MHKYVCYGSRVNNLPAHVAVKSDFAPSELDRIASGRNGQRGGQCRECKSVSRTLRLS